MPWQRVSPWIYPVWDSLHFLALIDYFLSHIREAFNYNLFKYFSVPFFLFFFWDPYNSNVGMFNVVPEISETVFITFLFIYLFIYTYSRFLLVIYFIHIILYTSIPMSSLLFILFSLFCSVAVISIIISSSSLISFSASVILLLIPSRMF